MDEKKVREDYLEFPWGIEDTIENLRELKSVLQRQVRETNCDGKGAQDELDLIADQIDRLNERLEDVPEVAGKVTKSSKDFPYIEEHMTVRMKEPKEATLIKDKLRKKEKRQEQLSQEITKVEHFIDSLPEGIEKQIMEMVYLEGMNQTDAAEMLGYTQARVSQIIRNTLKDL